MKVKESTQRAQEITEKFNLLNKITERVIGAAIEVHKELGPGLLERIYAQAFSYEFDLRKIYYETDVPIDVIYKKRSIKGQRLDFLIEEQIILEIKSAEYLNKVYENQLLT